MTHTQHPGAPREAMEGVTTYSEPQWNHLRYRGTRKALINAGVAMSGMFPELPKLPKYGWMHNGRVRNTRVDFDNDYRYFHCRRHKGGVFELDIKKTAGQLELERQPVPTITNAADFRGTAIYCVDMFVTGSLLEIANAVQRGHIQKREPRLSVVR